MTGQAGEGAHVAYFRKASEYGPWIECHTNEAGAKRFTSGRPSDTGGDLSADCTEAVGHIRVMMQFAYQQGFHELGYDPLGVLLAALAQSRAAIPSLIAAGALRQFRHNDDSEGFVFAYDKAITDREFALLASRSKTAGEAVGWLYDWTHSSALGKPDEHFTGFAAKREDAFRPTNTNQRLVCLAAPTAAKVSA